MLFASSEKGQSLLELAIWLGIFALLVIVGVKILTPIITKMDDPNVNGNCGVFDSNC